MIFKQQLTDISTVLSNTGNTTKLLTSFNALDIAQQKVLLSSSLLSEKQKEQCITMATLSAANTKYTAEQLAKATGISTETLANWGLIESTDALTISELSQRAASDAQAKAILDKIIAQNAEAVANGKIIASNTALTASEGGATLATGAFTTAIKANIKAMITWMTTTPLGWLTMLVGGVFLAVKAYDALTVSVKEQKEKMEDSLSAYKDAKSELSNITTELENQEQTMDDLLAKEKLTYAEQGQLEELQAITRELRIQKDLAEKEEGRTQKEVAKDASDLFNKQFGKYDISEDAIGEYQNNANITGNNAILISDENDISSMIAGYRQFNDLLDEAYGSESQEDIDHFKSLTEGLKDSIFETAQELQEQQSNIADYYNTIKDIPYDDLTTEQKGIVDSYNSISDAIELIYQQLDSNTWKSMQIESVLDTDGVEKTKEELIEMVKAGEFDESNLQSYPKLSAALEQNKVSASELRNELEALAEAEGNVKGDTFNDKYPISLSISQTIDQLNTQLKPAFDSLKSAYQDIFTDDGFTLENVDLSMLDSIRSSIEELNSMEDVNINIDYSSFENLATVLTDTTSTEDEVQEAINSLATNIVSALNPAISECSGESYQMVQALLESVGVMNSEEVMVSALGYTYEEYIAAKQECADAGFSLANATESEIEAFINEQGGAENCGIALATLQLKKLLVNSTSISTVSDVNQILSLANAANISANSLVALANAKAQFETASKIGDKQGMALAARGMKETSEKAKKDILNYKPVEIDFSPKGGSGNGGSKSKKDTIEEFDWIEKKIENLEEDISRLDKVADSSYSSISEKNEALAESIEKINEEISLQQQAYEQYMQKAESVGLSDEYKNLVQNGDINIEEIADEDLKEAIKNYEQWYDKAKETQDKINDLYVDAKDKHVAAYELAVGELEKLRESQAITEREYLDEMLVLYEKYYAAN